MSGSDGAVLATLISPTDPIQDKSATADADKFPASDTSSVDPMYACKAKLLLLSVFSSSVKKTEPNPYPNIPDLIAGVTCGGFIHSYCK